MDRNTANMDINVTPELRFPEFTDKWELKTLRELATKVNRRNRQLQVSRVLTNSATEGVIDQNDYFDRDIAVKENTENYHIVDACDFVYNPRISVSAPVGPISVNKIGTGIMSPLYTVFRFHDGYVPFFDQYFQTKIWHPYLKSIANFGARFDRMNITTEGFFNMPIVCPSFAEQKKIAECLEAEDRMIFAQEQKVESLKAHKKGLMQQLFPQPGATTPVLRFPGFTGEWEEKKLGECFEIGSGRDYKHLSTGDIPVYGSGGYMCSVNDYLFNGDSACIGRKGTINNPLLLHGKFWTVDTLFYTFNYINTSAYFVYLLFQNIDWMKHNEAGGVPSLSKTIINNISVVLPKPGEQQKIVECISSIEDIIMNESKKVEILKNHKKGLMQQLYPQPVK